MSWAHEKPTIFAGEDELQLKLKFAQLCARDWSNRAMAGYAVFPGEDNYARAMAAQAWLTDPVVQAEISRLRYEGADEVTPSKAELVKKMVDAADAATDPKVKIEGYYKAADVLGFVNKGSVNVTNNNDNRVVKVLRVPERVTEDNREDWKAGFKERQMKLVTDARNSRPN